MEDDKNSEKILKMYPADACPFEQNPRQTPTEMATRVADMLAKAARGRPGRGQTVEETDGSAWDLQKAALVENGIHPTQVRINKLIKNL